MGHDLGFGAISLGIIYGGNCHEERERWKIVLSSSTGKAPHFHTCVLSSTATTQETIVSTASNWLG
jgi:hypothetical protein